MPGRAWFVNNSVGELTIRSGGAISSGQDLEVEYEFKIEGSYAADEFDGDARNETVVNLPSISTARGCELAAKILVDELKTARWEADVQIPPGDLSDVSLVEALDLEAVPDEAMSVYELEQTPEGLQLRLGSRDRIRDALEQIRSMLSAASERV